MPVGLLKGEVGALGKAGRAGLSCNQEETEAKKNKRTVTGHRSFWAVERACPKRLGGVWWKCVNLLPKAGCDYMSLNIKNEETHRRARELARLAGETMTQAVDRAIAERLERIRKKRNRGALVERLLEIGHECAGLPMLDKRSPEEMLYDENGLPK